MKSRYDGFLLLEVTLALFIVTVGILFMLDGFIFLRTQAKQQQDMLELAIFASEITKFQLSKEDQAVQDKCQHLGIQFLESGDGGLILEKQGVILDISKQ